MTKRGYKKRMTYAKPWHMPRIPRGRSVGQKGGCSEGPGQSRPIQTVPESSARCRQGISVQDHNRNGGTNYKEKKENQLIYSLSLCAHGDAWQRWLGIYWWRGRGSCGLGVVLDRLCHFHDSISIKENHVRVMRIGHISGSGFGEQK